jgi:hypothetical protein
MFMTLVMGLAGEGQRVGYVSRGNLRFRQNTGRSCEYSPVARVMLSCFSLLQVVDIKHLLFYIPCHCSSPNRLFPADLPPVRGRPPNPSPRPDLKIEHMEA